MSHELNEQRRLAGLPEIAEARLGKDTNIEDHKKAIALLKEAEGKIDAAFENASKFLLGLGKELKKLDLTSEIDMETDENDLAGELTRMDKDLEKTLAHAKKRLVWARYWLDERVQMSEREDAARAKKSSK